MVLNESKGNMYGFVTHTWNVVKGVCPNSCDYCYMKRFPQKELRFVPMELFTDLGEDNFIFVGSSCDMWHDVVPHHWISKTLDLCREHRKNKYLFQSKCPGRFVELEPLFPKQTVLATTIETNRPNKFTGGEPVQDRALNLGSMRGYKKMVTIEPVMDFDPDEMIELLRIARADQVNIGADSMRRTPLPEPTKEKLEELIEHAQLFTMIHIKDNLGRLMK